MAISNKREPILFFAGDVAVLLVSLWGSLFLRNLELPTLETWINHLFPFSIIFAVSFLVFIISGLYENHTSRLRLGLPTTIIYAQLSNAAIAITFFYFIPFFGITPKVILFIFLIVSTVLLFIWRIYGINLFAIGRKDLVILIGDKDEMEEVAAEILSNNKYGLEVYSLIDINETTEDRITDIFSQVAKEGVGMIIADTNHPKVSSVISRYYDFILSQVTFFDLHDIYETMLDRVPVQSVNYSWLIKVNTTSLDAYSLLKRLTDLIISIPLFIVSLPFLILATVAILIEDGGKIFIVQERVGKKGRPIHLYKLRSMTYSDSGQWLTESDNKVTRVGYILRKTRIDELPQLINVIKGDISLIGPRPDIVGLGEKLVSQIPYYMTRYLVVPGLSGWAQIKQHKPPQSTEETILRLSYDLYYIKNRSFILDIQIALRTIKTLLSRTGM